MGGTSEDLKRTREYIQLLATLVATIAYQAGLDPPGGVWASNGEGHSVGDSILLTINPGRYKVFFYFNSAAFVASIVIVIMLQNEHLVRGHALEVALILDFFGLIGAYAAGSCRNTTTSIYTVALAGGVLIYVVIHIVFFTLDHGEDTGEKKDKYESHRVVLLLLAILAATLTYQAGLTPPGGFWEEDNSELGHRAGFPVLQDKYPRRYEAFFYCNTASFMASVALIVLLLNPNLYRPGIRCYALVVCMVAGVLGLLGAYAAGSSLHLRTSIIFLVLVVVGFAIVVGLAIHRHCVPPPPVTTTTTTATKVPEPNSGDPAPPNNVLEKQERPVTTTTTKVAEPNSGDPAPPNNVLEKQERSVTTTTTKVSESNSSDPAPPNNMLEKQERLVTTTKVPEPNSGNPALPPNNVLEKQERHVTTTNNKVSEPNSSDPAPPNNVLEKQERPVTTTTKVSEPNSGDPAPPNNVLEIQVRSVTITTTTTKVPEPNSSHPAPPNNGAEETAMYLMLVGILAASVTYLTGLKPPGGMWRGDGNGHSAGNPVLYDTNKLRYNIFFYSNSISFIASVVVIALLLLRMMLLPATAMVLGPIHAAMVLDMLFLLVAYAAGSVRDSHRSWKVIMIFPAVVLVVFFFFFVSRKQTVSRNQTEKAEESTVDGGEKGECKGPHSIRIIQL
jgi:hypothetical protein